MAWINHDCNEIANRWQNIQHGRARRWYLLHRCRFNNKIYSSFYNNEDLILPFGKDGQGNNDGSDVNYGTLDRNNFDKARTIRDWLDTSVKILLNNQITEPYADDDINPQLFESDGRLLQVNVNQNAFKLSDHGLIIGDKIYFENLGGVLPDPIDLNTLYWINDVQSNFFSVSLTNGGATVSLNDAGSGSFSFRKFSGRTLADRKQKAITWYQNQPVAIQQFVDDLIDWLDWKIEQDFPAWNKSIRGWFTS